jgi:hypothetical protein
MNSKARKITFSSLGAVCLSFYLYTCLRLGNDFWTFHDIGKFAFEKANIYDPSPTTGMFVFYLPHFSLLMMPFGLIPVHVAGAIWFTFKIAGLIWFFKFTKLRLDSKSGTNIPQWAPLVPLILLINPLNSDFKLGQVNLFVHLALIGSYVLLTESRKASAALLFVLASVKVTPLIFLIYFVIKKEIRFLAWFFIWSSLFLGMLALWFGAQAAEGILMNWWIVSSREKLGLSALAYFENQSLIGLFARLAESFPALPMFSGKLQFEHFSLPAFKAWAYGFSAMLLGLICLLTMMNTRSKDRLSSDLLFSLFFIIMLLASPDTRNAHLMHLLFPVLILWQVFYLRLPGAKLACIGLAVSGLGLILTSRDLIGKKLNHLLRENSHQTAILLVTFFVLLFILVGKVKANRVGILRSQEV